MLRWDGRFSDLKRACDRRRKGDAGEKKGWLAASSWSTSSVWSSSPLREGETRRDGVSRFFRPRHLWNGAFSAPVAPILATRWRSRFGRCSGHEYAGAAQGLGWRTSGNTRRSQGPGCPRSPAAGRHFFAGYRRADFHSRQKKRAKNGKKTTKKKTFSSRWAAVRARGWGREMKTGSLSSPRRAKATRPLSCRLSLRRARSFRCVGAAVGRWWPHPLVSARSAGWPTITLILRPARLPLFLRHRLASTSRSLRALPKLPPPTTAATKSSTSSGTRERGRAAPTSFCFIFFLGTRFPPLGGKALPAHFPFWVCRLHLAHQHLLLRTPKKVLPSLPDVLRIYHSTQRARHVQDDHVRQPCVPVLGGL